MPAKAPQPGTAHPADTVIVRDLATATAALSAAASAGRTVRLASPPRAADWLGVPGFAAVVRAATDAVPGACAGAVLDCVDAPGQALGALRAGLDASADEADPRARAALAAIAAACGRQLLARDPDALDLADRPEPAELARRWLAGRPEPMIPEQQESAR